MKHSYFIEIVTIGLFLIMFFNCHKIFIHIKLCIKSFIHKHIVQRVNPDLDLNLPLLAKEQPTGKENSDVAQDSDNKFILAREMGKMSFTIKALREYNPLNTFNHPTNPNAE